MQLLRRDTHLGAQTQLATVREAGRSVHGDRRGIDTRSERTHDGHVGRHDALGMTRGIAANMLDRLVNVGNDAHSQVHRQVLGLPVGLGRVDNHLRIDRGLAIYDGPGGLVRVDRHARRRQTGDRGDEETLGDVGVHEQSLRRVAHAHALRLRVHDDGLSGREVSGGVHVHVAVTRARLDDRNPRLFDDGIDEPRSPSRNQRIDRSTRAHHCSGTRAAPRIHRGDRIGGQADGGQRIATHLDEDAIRGLRGASTAQHDRVAGLQGKRGSVDRHVGAGLIDDANDTQGHALLRHTQTDIGAHAANHLTDRVRQTRDLADGLGDSTNTIRGQCEAIQ